MYIHDNLWDFCVSEFEGEKAKVEEGGDAAAAPWKVVV